MVSEEEADTGKGIAALVDQCIRHTYTSPTSFVKKNCSKKEIAMCAKSLEFRQLFPARWRDE